MHTKTYPPTFYNLVLIVIIAFVSSFKKYSSESFVLTLRKNEQTYRNIIKSIPTKHNTKLFSTISFSSPLLDEGYPPTVQEYKKGMLGNKPLLVYLPGFDGTLLAPFLQFPELGTEFDVWGMTVSMEDRSSVETLCNSVLEFIIEKLNDNHERQVYVMGESFGGILALEVTLAIMKHNESMDKGQSGMKINLGGLVLINPATSYNQSDLAKDGPSIAEGSPLLYPLKIMTLLPLFTDDYALPQLIRILQAGGLPSVIDTAEREAYMGRMAFSLPSKLKFMPQGTLKWRLSEWLTKGCTSIESRENCLRDSLGKLPVLIVAGEKDKTLPSVTEAYRLQEMLDNVDVHIVDGAGHACTCGSRVDLAVLMRKKFLPNLSSRRKEMQHEASVTTDDNVFFGLEPRYDGAAIGLSPLKYWSKEFYEKVSSDL
jgi:pimeloyl-ACP methyl ester carboxylesterase